MMIKCKVCGCEFPPVVDKHYVAKDTGKIGAIAALSRDEEKLYDAFDCPMCGCQVIVQERKRIDSWQTMRTLITDEEETNE